MKRMNRPHRKEKRRKEAEERQKAYDSIVDKYALINSRPGKSQKERDRILAKDKNDNAYFMDEICQNPEEMKKYLRLAHRIFHPWQLLFFV